MELIGSRLGNDVDDGAGKPTIFGTGVVGDDAQFRDGIHDRDQVRAFTQSVHRVGSVDQEAAVHVLCAADGDEAIVEAEIRRESCRTAIR